MAFAQCPTCLDFFEPTRRGHVFCNPTCGQRGRERERRGLGISDEETNRVKITPDAVAEMETALAHGCTVAEVANIWGVSRTTVYRRIGKEKTK